jgi:hypothetical protein
MKALAAAALCLALLAGCGGSKGGKAVAHVGNETIGRQQLDALVAHFRTEAQREGKAFPKEGTKTFERLRNQLLSLLVYRAELRQAAKRLGVRVDQSEVTRRLAPTGGGEKEGDPGGDTFARDSVETQLLTEGIFAKVTSGVGGKDKAERSARRNRKMADFLARLQRETQVRYEPGFAPGS